ncbi:hypothetical protein [Hirschia baltica]|uniref:Uncharacterized protein n=1 Tax=Hirschia baltica (strain ATCC 49814 / DSM 5838 / IFAM 1418) TaxID=582402 RepID=C6XL52_HIRBI|nr:hypothetical protein [Hirschia baltica]ACT57881.1 hypothetical protein Hbal_0179 [Hirschia baltica ATCC 49814]
MLTIDAREKPYVEINENDEVVIVLKSKHPLSEDTFGTAAFKLSPHNGLMLAKALQTKIAQVVSADRIKTAISSDEEIPSATAQICQFDEGEEDGT